MRYSNRMMIAVLLVFTTMMFGIPNVHSEMVKDVYVQGTKWTAYDVPASGADLKLNVNKGSAPPILSSHVRVEDTSDTTAWTNVSKTSDLHVYRILGVKPGHEWVAIEGQLGVAGGDGVSTGVSPNQTFEVGVVKAEIEEPDGLPAQPVVGGDSRFRANPSCFEWQFVHVNNEVVTYYATQKPKGLVAPIPPASYNWSVSAGTLNSATADTPTYVPNGPIPPLSALMNTVSLQLRPLSGNDLGKQERTLEIYRDHLARDYQNFGVGIVCGVGPAVSTTWKFSRYGIDVWMPHTWNCFGSVWHAYNGTSDGNSSAPPGAPGFSVSANYDYPNIPWSNLMLGLKRGDVVSFWTYDPDTNTEVPQHAHTCMGVWDQMYGANNEPFFGSNAGNAIPGGVVYWEGGSYQWAVTDSQKYFEDINRDWRNFYGYSADKILINRIRIHRKS